MKKIGEKQQKTRRGEITAKILEFISGAAGATSDMILGMLSARYGASMGKMEYETSKHHAARERAAAERVEQARLRQRYYSLMSYLKDQGLIEVGKRKGKTIFKSTFQGRMKLHTLKQEIQARLPQSIYEPLDEKAVVIVVYDIPEKEHRKREWIRAVLKRLGLKKIQQSVWLGKYKLSKEFIDDLNRFNLIDCVEIFEVSKTGSLQHVL